MFRSGFVTLIGRPNVGKSTLMNLIVGQKIAIISNKPQTTRNKIMSIYSDNEYQIIFLDTPGIHKPTSKLGEYMVKTAENAMNEVDCILYLVEPRRASNGDKKIISRLSGINTPVLLVINKIDTVEKPALLEIIDDYRSLYEFSEIFAISALRAENTDELLAAIKKLLPEGPKYFPEDVITDQPERQITAELIREKALYYLRDEVPHGLAVEVSQMKTRENKALIDVDATIYCDKETHKGIIIGKNGSMLKKIGATARQDIERLLGSPIFLQLWVKVKKDWRNSDFYLRNFGYDQKSNQS
ncbi:MAG: GTPase Era [Clostridiales bacterium]|jgi:GTP-binding protein Era|nr:GTPase Era [Clostridiales bacterium]